MATSPRAFGLGPLETIVNVGWGEGGTFACVRTYAEYQHGVVGSRTSALRFPPVDKLLRGTLVAERTFTTEAQEGMKANTVYLALAQFSGLPKPTDASARGFVVELDGSTTYTPPYDAPLVPPFCGTYTLVESLGAIYSTPIPGVSTDAVNLWQDLIAVETSPAGQRTLMITHGPLAGLSKDDIGSGAMSVTSTHQSIWYRDSAGNWIDTGAPCSELPPPGDPAPPPERTEGWRSIQWALFPRQHYKAVDAALWTKDFQPPELVKASTQDAFGGPMMMGEIPTRVLGKNSDGLPIHDDLPQGDYEFRLAAVQFRQFLPQIPPQQQAAPGVPQLWALPFAYPLTPTFARYFFGIGTNKPTPFKYHNTLPPYDPQTAAPFPPSVLPPADQQFEP